MIRELIKLVSVVLQCPVLQCQKKKNSKNTPKKPRHNTICYNTSPADLERRDLRFIFSAKEDFVVVMVTAGVTGVLQRTVLSLAPRSFSLGEAAVVAHGFVLLFYTSHSFKKGASNETDFLQVTNVVEIG